MRRSEKEITDRDRIDDFLDGQNVLRLGMVDGDTPYVLPLNFVRIGNAIYLHCAREGRKLEILSRNPKVCFEADRMERIVSAPTACSWGVKYTSVTGTGTARIVETPEEKKLALRKLMEKHSGRSEWEIPEQAVQNTVVLRIDINDISGKHAG